MKQRMKNVFRNYHYFPNQKSKPTETGMPICYRHIKFPQAQLVKGVFEEKEREKKKKKKQRKKEKLKTHTVCGSERVSVK